jgi:hypothetical protein
MSPVKQAINALDFIMFCVLSIRTCDEQKLSRRTRAQRHPYGGLVLYKTVRLGGGRYPWPSLPGAAAEPS